MGDDLVVQGRDLVENPTPRVPVGTVFRYQRVNERRTYR